MIEKKVKIKKRNIFRKINNFAKTYKMALKLRPIDVVENITKEEFEEKYLKPRIPVVLKKCKKLVYLRKMVTRLHEKVGRHRSAFGMIVLRQILQRQLTLL